MSTLSVGGLANQGREVHFSPPVVWLLQNAAFPKLLWHRLKPHRGEELLRLLKHLLLVPALAEHRPGHIEVGLARVRLQDVPDVAPLLGPPGSS